VFEERRSRSARLIGAKFVGAEHDPVAPFHVAGPREFEHGSPATDFDVVRMRAHAQHTERFVAVREGEVQHASSAGVTGRSRQYLEFRYRHHEAPVP
jgi:hypothetical protein